MRKITLLFLLLTANFAIGQTWTTGTIPLTTGYTVQFDINTGTNTVTMTMVGPDNRFLGVGPGSTLGQGMGDQNNDAIIFNPGNDTVEDRQMNAGTGLPPLDNTTVNGPASTLDWTTVSFAATGGVRTVVATRAINTGDSKDFVFPTSATSFNLIWSMGPTNGSITYHGGTRSGTTANLTLSTEQFEAPTTFSIHPNPSSDVMNINLPQLTSEGLQLEVFDVLGKRVYVETLNTLSSKISISNWNSGLYLVRLESPSGDITLTKRFVKL